MEISSHVICIGNEIMLGHINNTNAQHISENLSSIGIKTAKHLSIPDDPKVIIDSIKNSLRDANIVIVTGGLGPTVDDLTLDCIAKALDRKLIFKDKVADYIRQHFKKRGLKMPKNNLRQALIPQGAAPILNNIGSAPGLIIPSPFPLPKGERVRVRGSVLIALPGVPFEIHDMMENTVLGFLKKRFSPSKLIKSRVIKITGLPESKVNEKIEDILKLGGNVQMGIYPHPEEITVKITVTDKNPGATIKKIERKIKSRLGNYIFGYDDERLEEVVGKLLLKKKKTLAVAESCTAGLLANRITDVSGSSKYFRMGVVTYSNQSKNKLLNVTVKKHGAVSIETASAMAKNVRLLADASIGIGISGIAGPTGGTKNKPVGIVYIALSTKKKTMCKEFRFLGQRNIVKFKASQAALNFIRLHAFV
ncbi:MAG: competence/damage-inducible protein A [Candidatus Omnitrophica bacterium]|nr:competence/damage-inducible protein A [Candidatus Omnitrophota bacterium]